MLEEWILALAGSEWIYLGIYAFATIDGFFPPIPSESVVIAVAAMAMVGDGPNLWLLMAAAAAGAFTGDQIAYAVGRRVDVHHVRFLRGRRGRQAVAWAEHALAHRGSSFILAARYIPVGRVAVNMTAGALGYRRRRFMALTALAAVTWAAYGTAIGVGAGAWLHDHPVIAVVAGVVVGVVVGLLVDWVLRRWLQPGVPAIEPVAADDGADDPAADSGPVAPLARRTAETRPAETRPVGTRPLDGLPVDARPAETRPVETRPVETRPVDARPLDTRNVDTRAVDGRGADARSDVRAAPRPVTSPQRSAHPG